MATFQIPEYVNNQIYVAASWGNQTTDNIMLLNGNPDKNVIKENLFNVSTRLDNVQGSIDTIKLDMDTIRVDAQKLRADVDKKLDTFAADIAADIADIRLYIDRQDQVILNHTGLKDNLNPYFNDPATNQRRNIVLSVNKLLDDLGFVQQLTTTYKTTAIGAINELDKEIGDLPILSNTNDMSRPTIVATLNRLNEIIGDLTALFPINKVLLNDPTSVVASLNKLEALLGNYNTITAQIKRDTFVLTLNQINTLLGELAQIEPQIKQNSIILTLNKINQLLGQITSVTDTEISGVSVVEIINKIKAKIGTIANTANVNTQNKGNSIEEIINKFDAMFGLFSSIEAQIKGNTYTETFNKINQLLGDLTKISNVNTQNKGVSIVDTINKIDLMLGVFNNIHQDIKGASYTETFNKIQTLLEGLKTKDTDLQTKIDLKQDKLIAGINVEITEDNVINVKGDVATTATEVTQTNQALGDNVQTALDILNSRYMIPPYYIQYPDTSGNFNANEEPSNWYKKMYNITTTWQIMFNSESVYFRTEGDLANVGRSSGIQGDAIRNITGFFDTAHCNNGNHENWNGKLFSYATITFNSFNSDGAGIWSHVNTGFNASRVVPTANENRVKNRLIRIYKLLTINGKNISDIIGA